MVSGIASSLCKRLDSNGRKTQEPLESSAIVEAAAIVARLIFLFRFTCSHVSADTAPMFPVQQAALFPPLIFSGTASG